MTVLHLVRTSDRAPDVSDDPVQQFEAVLYRQGLADNTVRAYLADVHRYGLDLPEAFTNPDAHAELAASIVNEDAPPRSRLRRLASLSRFYAFANPEATTNPYRTVQRPRLGVTLPAVVPEPDESRALIEALRAEGTSRGTRDAAALALMAGAGLRVGEVVTLTGEDYDPDRRRLHFEGKGRRTRDVPVSGYVLAVMADHLTRNFSVVRPDTRIFPVTPRTLQRAVKRAADTVGLPDDLHPHALRHGFGTAVQATEKDLRLTADLLGHASVQTTMIYTHVADSRRASAVDAAL